MTWKDEPVLEKLEDLEDKHIVYLITLCEDRVRRAQMAIRDDKRMILLLNLARGVQRPSLKWVTTEDWPMEK